MPMHDWTRVEPNYYHDFHQAWITALRTALNTGGLPPGYYALAEQVTPPISPDVLALQVPGTDPGGGVAVASPRAELTAAGRRVRTRTARARRVAIRHNSDHRLAAVIEIVSPGNKASRREFVRFVDKAVVLLDRGVHLLVVDPFPPTPRDPRGLHAAVWRALTRQPFEPPPGRPLAVASYEAAGGDEFRAYVQPLAVGDALPDMAVCLAPALYAAVPLESTYQAAWAGFPAPWRDVVAAP